MIQHCPTPTELDDLELLVSGASPRSPRFNEPGSPVTLDLPDGADRGASSSTPRACRWPGSRADGDVEPLTHAQYGPFRRLHLTPAAGPRAARRSPPSCPVADALTDAELDELRGLGRVRPARARPAPAPPRSPPSRWSAPPWRRPTCSTTPTSSPSRSPPTATPTPTTRSAPRCVGDLRRRRPGPRAGRRTDDGAYPARHRRDRRRATGPSPTSRASCSSSPACPAAASRRWPAR